jgi:hypothetical protein
VTLGCPTTYALPASEDILTRRITDLDRVVRELGPSIAASFVSTIQALPTPAADSNTTKGFGVTNEWSTQAHVSLPTPAGKTRATILAIATGAVVDMATGGLAHVDARITIGDNIGEPTASSKDHGASAVNNIFTTTHSAQIVNITTPTIDVTIQITASNPAAFPPMPGNYTTLTVIGIFSKPDTGEDINMDKMPEANRMVEE